jgi:hypothetical protein
VTHRTIAARVLTAGLIGAAAGVLTSRPSPGQGLNRPAAWLSPAVATPEPVARAAEPETTTFQSVFPPGQASAASKSNSPPSPWAGVMMQQAPASAGPSDTPQKKDEPSVFGRAWNSVKGAFSSTPQNGPDATAKNPQTTNQRPQSGGPNQKDPRFYTAPPAYRWYGWGTTTPGLNIYAPDGYTYPAGSARWFVHTGATPGAFPAAGPPAMTRVSEGGEPPVYVGQPVVQRPLITSEPPMAPRVGSTVTPPPGVVTGSMPTPAPVVAAPRSVVMPSSPAVESPAVVPTVPVQSTPTPVDSAPQSMTRPTPDADPLWQPAREPNAATGSIIPSDSRATTDRSAVISAVSVTPADAVDPGWMPAKGVLTQVVTPAVAGVPTETLLELERAVREACRTSVTVTELASPGPGKLTVKYTAPTVSAAEEAVITVTRMAQLKPYVVEFDGRVVGK